MTRAAWAVVLAATGLAMVMGTGCELRKGEPAAPTAAVSDLVRPDKKPDPLNEQQFVVSWNLLGPFTFKEKDFAGEHQQASADHEFMKNEGKLDGTQPAPTGTKWQATVFKGSAQTGQVDLDAHFGGPEYAAAYAVAWLNSPEEIKDAVIHVGSDDYIKVWVNGKLVHTYKTERRASDPDQDNITGITLKKGLNRIVVKCVDVVLAWDFYFRVADSQDKPLLAVPCAAAAK